MMKDRRITGSRHGREKWRGRNSWGLGKSQVEERDEWLERGGELRLAGNLDDFDFR
jgi:hypothetical protein